MKCRCATKIQLIKNFNFKCVNKPMIITAE